MKRLTVVFMTVAAFGLMATTAAQAGTAQKATGSIRMGMGTQTNDPKQAIAFDVFESADEGEHHVHELRARRRGFGCLGARGFVRRQFGVDPNDSIVSTYTFTIGTVTPLSPTSLSFAGNGVHRPVRGTVRSPGRSLARRSRSRSSEQDGARELHAERYRHDSRQRRGHRHLASTTTTR